MLTNASGAAQGLQRWSAEQAQELYNISGWSNSYFDVDPDGDVTVQVPFAGCDKSLKLREIIDGLNQRGLTAPVLLRFSDILEASVTRLNEHFLHAIKEWEYRGGYRGVYPIKVNQQKDVVQGIVEAGAPYHHGLEVGSKSELLVAIAELKDPEALLVCNGYKDEEFITLALQAAKMGQKVILVVEMPGELPSILECADRMGVSPMIGVRARLSQRAEGHWTDSAGDFSRFGLSIAQIVDVVAHLKAAGRLDCLKMLHYHMGSQLSNIRLIRAGLNEACRVYGGLVEEGAAMGILNIGGGLAIDYDGSNTGYGSSRNYSLDEYCSGVVETISTVMNEMGVDHPMIVSESGRAVTAHHAVLIFNVLDVSRFECPNTPIELPVDCHELLQSLTDVLASVNEKNYQACFHDAAFYRDELRDHFLRGNVGLRERAIGERLCWQILVRIEQLTRKLKFVPEEIAGLDKMLNDTYYCNFSLFQSLPDSWAIDQIFPVMPIHRLNEKPTRQATIADMTCDCDGRIDRFVDLRDVKHALPVHQLKDGEDYYLGVFLVGAYQETLGDLHNLFGDTNVATVRIGDDGGIDLLSETLGDSVESVLSYVEYEPKEVFAQIKRKAEAAVRSGTITPEERKHILENYEAGLRGYTYYES